MPYFGFVYVLASTVFLGVFTQITTRNRTIGPVQWRWFLTTMLLASTALALTIFEVATTEPAARHAYDVAATLATVLAGVILAWAPTLFIRPGWRGDNLEIEVHSWIDYRNIPLMEL